MVRIHACLGLAYEVSPPGADFFFNIQAARTAQQSVVWEQLNISPFVFSQESIDPITHNRMLRMFAPSGHLNVDYQCTVDICHHLQAAAQIPEVPVSELPASILPYLYPSRYCQSDCLGPLVMSQFGTLQRGYARVQAVMTWVRQHLVYKPNTSYSSTSALETLRDGVGVCRDFAHLMIALCRALNIPARFTTGFEYGIDPTRGPPDFHAYVEVYLGDRWYLFDPSGSTIPMGLIRIGTGRDAADVSFATIFGEFTSASPSVQLSAEEGLGSEFEIPVQQTSAISTA